MPRSGLPAGPATEPEADIGGPGVEHWETIAAERRLLADDLAGLTDEQWGTPSLCGDWTVRHVVGHLVVQHKTSGPQFLLAALQAGGRLHRASSRMAVREGTQPTEELVADLRRFAERRFTPPGFGSEAPLTDIMIHGCDIRIPLGLPDRGPEPFGPVLDLLVTNRARRGFVPRRLPVLRFEATDLDWSHGNGPTVRARAMDLSLALTGRTARLDALSDEGRAPLAAWVRG